MLLRQGTAYHIEENCSLQIDTLRYIIGCLGGISIIEITENTYFRHSSFSNDVKIEIDEKTIKKLNKQIDKLKGIKSKDRTKRTITSDHCTGHLIIINNGESTDLGRFTYDKPPRIFKKIAGIIKNIET